MAIFSAYRYADSSWRQQWRDYSDFNGMLSCFFDSILTTMRAPLRRRQLPSLFNVYRDRVRDRLSIVGPVNFPRFGPNSIAVSDVFVCISHWEGDHPLVSLKFICDDESHQPRTEEYGATFVLLLHNVAPDEYSFTKKPTLQLWLSSYFRKMGVNPPQCQSCSTPFSRSSLSVIPLPWIWIDIPPGDDQRFTMSTALTLEQGSGPNVSYTLTGIIYEGGTHFSARFKDASGRWWAYDGMVNSGRPSLDQIIDDAQLTSLRGRAMHILLYRLEPTDPTTTISST